MKLIGTSSLAALVIATGIPVGAMQAPDNTRANKAQSSSTDQTADKSSNKKADVEITRQIRKEIVQDKGLSSYAHNVKIIASNGKVTLKGPVHTEDEKKAIEDHARKVAGDSNVVSEIIVKGDSK